MISSCYLGIDRETLESGKSLCDPGAHFRNAFHRGLTSQGFHLFVAIPRSERSSNTTCWLALNRRKGFRARHTAGFLHSQKGDTKEEGECLGRHYLISRRGAHEVQCVLGIDVVGVHPQSGAEVFHRSGGVP